MSTKCTVCTKAVYPVEMIKIDDIVMHKACLKCAHCNGVLSLGKYAAINGKYYCKPHFKQLFALKGNYTSGFSETDSGASSSLGGVQFGSSATPASPKKEASQTLLDKRKSHNDIAKAGSTASLHVSSDDIKPVTKVSEGIRNSINNLKSLSKSNLTGSKTDLNKAGSSNNLNQKSRLHTSNQEVSANAKSRASAFNQAANSNSKKCTQCDKTVFPMEQLMVETNIFHKTCFRCAHCNNILSLGKYAALDSKYYCKPHFKQLFALKGNYNEGFGTQQHKQKWINKSGSEHDVEQATEKAAAMQV